MVTTEAPIELIRSRHRGAVRARLVDLLDVGIFGALLVLIAVIAVPYGGVEPWWEAVFECGVFALGALWMIQILLGRSHRISGYSVLLPLVATVGFAFVQTLSFSKVISADPFETRSFALKLLALILAAALLLRFTSSQRRLRILVQVVIGVGAASALFGMVRYAAQVSPGFGLHYLIPGIGYGQFINGNHFAFLMEMTLGLALGLAIGAGVRSYQLLIYLTLAALVGAALVLSNSRGGIFSMLSQVLLVGLIFTKAQPSRDSLKSRSGRSNASWHARSALAVRLFLTVCLMIAVTFSIFWVGGERLTYKFDSMPREFSTDALRKNISRMEIWRATWRLIKANPIAGVGFGGYWVAIPQYHDASGETTPQQAHNDYLEVLASGGVIGAVLFGWFVVALTRRTRERLRSNDPFRRAACFGALVGLFGVAVHSFVDFGLHVTINALVFTALVVVATVEMSSEETKAADDADNRGSAINLTFR